MDCTGENGVVVVCGTVWGIVPRVYVGTFIRNSIRVPEKFKQYRYLPVFFLSHTGTGQIQKNSGKIQISQTDNGQIPQTCSGKIQIFGTKWFFLWYQK
jgi:hypothetical protein